MLCKEKNERRGEKKKQKMNRERKKGYKRGNE